MAKALHVTVIEPYYGGSHRAFVDAWQQGSRHRITLVTLPARKWKWRMRGAAAWFTREANEWAVSGDGPPTDLVFCSDMLSVADLRALLPPALRNVPIVCYFHENQLTYPIPEGQQRDFQYGMTNITSCLAADAVWFNSRFHRDSFLKAAGALLGKMPDFVPTGVLPEIRHKAKVVPPPVLVERDDGGETDPGKPFTILWPHRWEYDKNPEPFFDALLRLHQAGRNFNVVLVGQQFRSAPPVFSRICERLGAHIVHAGYIPDRTAYLTMLSGCDLVVSSAIQENFGIAVAEAVLTGCQPLLPARLAYPELIPPGLHDKCLYSSDACLFERLDALLAGQGILTTPQQTELQGFVEEQFGARRVCPRIDAELAEIVQNRGL